MPRIPCVKPALSGRRLPAALRHVGRCLPRRHAAFLTLILGPGATALGLLGGFVVVDSLTASHHNPFHFDAERSLSSSDPAASLRNSSWLSSPICTSAMSVKPASQYSRIASTMASRSGPQGMDSATSSGLTNCVAPSNPAVVGRSELTAHPPANQRN